MHTDTKCMTWWLMNSNHVCQTTAFNNWLVFWSNLRWNGMNFDMIFTFYQFTRRFQPHIHHVYASCANLICRLIFFYHYEVVNVCLNHTTPISPCVHPMNTKCFLYTLDQKKYPHCSMSDSNYASPLQQSFSSKVYVGWEVTIELAPFTCYM